MPLDHAVQAESDAALDTLHDRLFTTRRLTDQLTAPLSDEDQVVQAMDDASPTKWHIAHTTWFFEAFVLNQFLPGYQVFDDRFEFCFNSYYEAVGPRHPRQKRGMLTKPAADDVRAFRTHVDEGLRSLFAGGHLNDDARELIELGINHEQQHQELMLTDILSLFALGPLRPAYRSESTLRPLTDTAPVNWIECKGGVHTVGHRDGEFAYDNEGPAHAVLLRPYRLADRTVTNGEWMAFMADGGYETASHWLSDGWGTAQSEGWRAPHYWEETDDGWQQMSLQGLRAIDLSAPVAHVSYFEADAYARWTGKRLPTEFEWEVASGDVDQTGRLLNVETLRPLAASTGEQGLKQMFGDVWEWTSSPYTSYPGYRPVEGAVGEYNGKFMCNQFVLKGGSCVTPEGHVRRTYRNFFYPHQRWQFSGLRLADDI